MNDTRPFAVLRVNQTILNFRSFALGTTDNAVEVQSRYRSSTQCDEVAESDSPLSRGEVFHIVDQFLNAIHSHSIVIGNTNATLFKSNVSFLS